MGAINIRLIERVCILGKWPELMKQWIWWTLIAWKWAAKTEMIGHRKSSSRWNLVTSRNCGNGIRIMKDHQVNFNSYAMVCEIVICEVVRLQNCWQRPPSIQNNEFHRAFCNSVVMSVCQCWESIYYYESPIFSCALRTIVRLNKGNWKWLKHRMKIGTNWAHHSSILHTDIASLKHSSSKYLWKGPPSPTSAHIMFWKRS